MFTYTLLNTGCQLYILSNFYTKYCIQIGRNIMITKSPSNKKIMKKKAAISC